MRKRKPGAERGPFGEALKREREARDLSQDQLATQAGVGRGTIAMLESGQTHDPRWNIACALAKGLRTSLDRLADYTPPVPTATLEERIDRLSNEVTRTGDLMLAVIGRQERTASDLDRLTSQVDMLRELVVSPGDRPRPPDGMPVVVPNPPPRGPAGKPPQRPKR